MAWGAPKKWGTWWLAARHEELVHRLSTGEAHDREGEDNDKPVGGLDVRDDNELSRQICLHDIWDHCSTKHIVAAQSYKHVDSSAACQ